MGAQMTEIPAAQRLQQAIQYKAEGRYDEAERELLAILDEEPNNLPARREWGLVLGFTGRFDESIDELKRVVQADPTYLDARVDLALTCSMLGMVDEAKAELEAVLAVEPEHPQARRHIVYFQ